MASISLFLDLVPLPPKDASTIRLGLHLHGAFSDLHAAETRVGDLASRITAIPGSFPRRWEDVAGSKPWKDLEDAYTEQLGEFLPWTWESMHLKLFADGDYLAGDPLVLAPNHPMLSHESLLSVRRGYLRALHQGSGEFKAAAPFDKAYSDASGASFSFLVYTAQSSRWPAPIPQEALGSITILEIPRASLATLPAGARVCAVLALKVQGREYSLPTATDIKTAKEVPAAQWQSAAASDVAEFTSASLDCAEILQPPNNDESFLHPAASLWLRDKLQNAAPFEDDEHGPGVPIADHDWWSRLHDGVAGAADLARLLIEALRRDPQGKEVDQDFEATFLTFCAVLRDRLEPGIACERNPVVSNDPVAMYHFPRAPAMLDVLIALRAADPSERTPLDLLGLVLNAGEHGWNVVSVPPASMSANDLGRVSLVYCALHRERFAEPMIDTWYEQLRCLVPQAKLPPRADLASFIAPLAIKDRIALMESLRVEAMRAEVRAKALFDSWHAAARLGTADPPLLGQAKAQAQLFLRTMDAAVLVAFFEKQDCGPLFGATAALNVAASASRARPAGAPKARFAVQIAEAVVEHAVTRLGTNPVFRPALTGDPLRFKALQSAADAAAEEAHRWIFRRNAVDETGEPGPLVLEIDTLSDDGDLQNQQTDLNVWLNGYCAFFRRAGLGQSPWGSGQIGVVESSMWDTPLVLTDAGGSPVTALCAQPASSSYGVRQVLLQHSNRTQLPAEGLDVIDDTSSTQTSNGWQGSEAFRVVAGASHSAARLPFLAFGIRYEAVLFAQSRVGVLPFEMAGASAADAPYRLDLSVDLEKLFAKTPVRTLPYLRRSNVSAPRVSPRPALLDPQWSPLSVSRRIELAGTAFAAEAGEDANAVCVLMSAAGLPTGESVQSQWKQLVFEVMPPACTHPVYDRWIAYDEAVADSAAKPKWRDWRERIHASELLASALKGQRFADEAVQRLVDEVLVDRRAQLHDPAVTAFVATWKSLRGDGSQDLPHTLKLDKPNGPLVPTPHNPNDDSTVLFDRGRYGPNDWQNWRVEVQVHEGLPRPPNRFIESRAQRVLTVLVFPGEIGDLVLSSAVHKDDLVRCDLAEQAVEGDYRMFESWRARFEVATAHRLPEADLYVQCVADVSDARDIRMYWTRERGQPQAGNAPAMLLLDNIGQLRTRRQVWHSTGRPLPAFPAPRGHLDDMKPLAHPQDGSPDPTVSGVLWDAIGFAERFETSASWSKSVSLTVGSTRQVFLEEPAGSDASPRYVRYAIEATHRYASLYLPMMGKAGREHFSAYVAEQSWAIPDGDQPAKDRWKRAFRPGADVPQVPRPAVRLVVPLTRSLDREHGTGADLLVVLNEELETTSPLLTRLEAGIEVVTRTWADGTTRSLLEFGPDPILSGDAQAGTFVGLSCIGPLGHTFDTDTREPYFVGTSYLVRSSQVLQAWEMAKLRFRRLLLPELMAGYFGAATPNLRQPVTLPTLGPLEAMGSALTASGQAHLSMMNIPCTATGTLLTVDFFGNSLPVVVARTEAQEDEEVVHAWTLSVKGPFPALAFLDTQWHPSLRVKDKLTDDALLSADFRLVVARIRDAKLDEMPPIPALWELAAYVAVSSRPPPLVPGQEFAAAWDRQWQRILTWQLEEPDEIDSVRVRLQSSELARHGVVQSVARVSDYSPAEWVQTLPDVQSLSIAGKHWIEKKPRADLSLRVLDAGARVLGLFDGDTDAVLNWKAQPVPHGKEGQGLHHALLVTKVVQAADGSQSEAYFGIFNHVSANRFQPQDLYVKSAPLPMATDLRAYVMLLQASPRSYAKAIGFWDSLFPQQGDGTANANLDAPRQTQDARLRILAVGEPIQGEGV